MEMFFYGFMQRAFQAAFLISLIAPILGLFLILRRQSLIADTLSHVSLAGVAIGLLAGVSPLWTTILVVVFVGIILEYLREVYRTYSEVSIAILMTAGLAVALVLMSFNETDTTISLQQYLFGSIVTIGTGQVETLAGLSIGIILLYLIFRKPMYVLTFDEDTAFTAGLPIRLMSILFNVLTGVTIAVIMPILGALLVSSILVLPAAISMQIGKTFRTVIGLGMGIALIGMFSGLSFSFYLGTPPGATIALIFVLLFVFVLIGKKSLKHIGWLNANKKLPGKA